MERQPAHSNISTNVRSFYGVKKWQIKIIRSAFGVLQLVAPKRSVGWAADLFCMTRKHKRPATEEWLLKEAAEHSLQVDGQRIAVWKMGVGPTIGLVHGWEGRGTQLATIAHALKDAGFQVVMFDGPGHGRSDGKRSSVPQMARALIRVNQEFGPFFAVVGHSFGTAATSLAIDKGLLTKRLVYLSPAADFEEYLMEFANMIGLSDATREAMKAELESRFQTPWSQIRQVNLCRTRKHPLLVIHDADDREIPLSAGRKVADSWSKGQLVVTSGLGHRRILKSLEVANLIVEFLTDRQKATNLYERPHRILSSPSALRMMQK